MGETTLTDLAAWADSLTVVGLLIFIFYTGVKKPPAWVFGWMHREWKAELLKQLAVQKQELDAWRAAALTGTKLGEDALKLAAAPAPPIEPGGE